MKAIKKAAIIAASDHSPSEGDILYVRRFAALLENSGIEAVAAPHIYETASAPQRAEQINRLALDGSIDAFFDISGGDLANSTLLYLDIPLLRDKVFFGYSDLTCIINASTATNGNINCLYRPYNALDTIGQTEQFLSLLKGESEALTGFNYSFLQGESMKGIVIGGNIRCLLKLAGTPYFTDVDNKIIFLESRSGNEDRIRAYLAQLALMGVFIICSGVLLGTFTECDRLNGTTAVEGLIKRLAPSKPIARTMEIGHAQNSKALMIGGYYEL